MIIEPDFLDHWKTRLLIRLLDTEAAPTYVIRLWSHCQTRKTNRFQDWNPEILAAVCKWTGDAQQFWGAMMQTFCRQQERDVIAHQWDEVNAGLIASWSNGGKGGRPKKPTGNPQITHGLPTGYPAVNPESNQVNPQVTRGVTDREEKIEKNRKETSPKSEWDVGYGIELPEAFRTQNCLAAVKLWLQHKAEKRESYKKTGLTAALTKWSNEFSASEFPSIVDHSIASGWSGIFRPRNIQQSSQSSNGRSSSNPMDAMDIRNYL